MHFDCLVVDDEVELATSVAEYLNLFEVSADYALTSASALEFLARHTVSIILLDVNLGDESGFALCKEIRKTHDVPILFVSARTSPEDQLVGFELGGDDYITKPYSLAVLLAKVRAILKRRESAGDSDESDDGRRLRIDASTDRVLLDGAPLELTVLEDRLLRALLSARGRILDKQELYEQVWGHGLVSPGTLNVHIRRLREKIEPDRNEPTLIKTVWGVGYVYDEAA